MNLTINQVHRLSVAVDVVEAVMLPAGFETVGMSVTVKNMRTEEVHTLVRQDNGGWMVDPPNLP